MAWNDPAGFNWEAGKLVFGAFMDAYLRDNLNETAPAVVTTLGDLVVADGANSIARLGVGTNDQVLIADSAQPLGVRWGAAGGGALELEINAVGDLLVGFADNDAQRLGIGSDGQSLVADAGETLGVRWSPVLWEAVLLDAFCRNFGEMDVRGLWVANSLFDRVYSPGRVLTMNGNVRGRFDESTPVGYWDFDGTGDFLSFADHADFDVTGALTLGGWFNVTNVLELYVFLSKFGAAGQRSYQITLSADSTCRAQVSGDGTALISVSSSNSIVAGNWFFISARYEPSVELQIDLNGTNTSNVTSIPASLFNSTAQLRVGADNSGSGTQELVGRAATAFVVAGLALDAEIADYFDRTRPVFGV